MGTSSSFIIGLTSCVDPAQAGEVGTKITKAVTTSDIGVAVRRSVVGGAQTMDKIDGAWENFSDRFGLGAARSQQPGRPKKKDIPPLKPLDKATARSLIQISDQVFVAVTGLSQTTLNAQLKKVFALARPSFERSGVSPGDGETIDSAEQLNFISYVHFKAFSDLLIENKIKFGPFKEDFESKCGEKILALILHPDYRPPSRSSDLQSNLQSGLDAVDKLNSILVEKGLIAQCERSELESESLADWVADASDLQFSIALDEDATLGAQILLQEQGFRLIPNFARYAIAVLLQQEGQKLTLEEYYMDTNYNSDPDLFEVKEVLLNVVLESK